MHYTLAKKSINICEEACKLKLCIGNFLLRVVRAAPAAEAHMASNAHTGDTFPANAADTVCDSLSYELTTIWRDVPSGGALILPPLVV